MFGDRRPHPAQRPLVGARAAHREAGAEAEPADHLDLVAAADRLELTADRGDEVGGAEDRDPQGVRRASSRSPMNSTMNAVAVAASVPASTAEISASSSANSSASTAAMPPTAAQHAERVARGRHQPQRIGEVAQQPRGGEHRDRERGGADQPVAGRPRQRQHRGDRRQGRQPHPRAAELMRSRSPCGTGAPPGSTPSGMRR